MAYDSIQRYQKWYSNLVRLYPNTYHARFGESIEQTFKDCLRERTEHGGGLFVYVLWIFVETSCGIIRENSHYMITQKRTLVFVLAALSLLLVPFFAMQFQISGWDWHLSDFVIMAVLLSGAGSALAAGTNAQFPIMRRAIAIGIVGLLILLYVHLAVGIVDTWPLAGS